MVKKSKLDKKTHSEKMFELLRIYAAKGYSLHGENSVCRPLRRSPLTIMKYCRKGGISLADYSPRNTTAQMSKEH